MSRLEQTGDERCIDAIVRRVARREGESPLDLPPLARSIDPDALVALLDHPSPDTVTVEFAYCGYDVTVDSNGTLDVAEGN